MWGLGFRVWRIEDITGGNADIGVQMGVPQIRVPFLRAPMKRTEEFGVYICVSLSWKLPNR